MALTPQWAPLEVAVFMSFNLTAQALYLRKQLKDQPPPSQGRIGTTVTTVKTGK
jgi:hypothetical protein